jgi:carbonic anhydrase
MNRLLDGYRNFRATTWPEHRDLYERLAAQGQRPRTLVIACSDSRADPALIFGAAPGELFVIRNVANLVPPFAPDEAHHGTSAALEFGVRQLEVADIVVMGHAMCGGIHALLNGPSDPTFDFVGGWIAMARAAADRVLACVPAEQAQTACEHESVRLTLANLMTFPWIRDRVRAGTLALHGAFFDIRTGRLERLGPDGAFAPVA